LNLLVFMKHLSILKKLIIAIFVSTISIWMIDVIHSNSNIENMFTSYKTDQENTNYIDFVVEYHQSITAFDRRPMMSFSIIYLKKALNINAMQAFKSISYVLFAFCGILIFFISIKLNDNILTALISQCSFFLTFSILYSFIIPIYTYDEPFQYLFVLISIYFLTYEIYLMAAISFGLACIARETSFVLIIGSLFFIKPSWDILVKAGFFILAAILYGLWMYVYSNYFYNAPKNSDVFELAERSNLLEFNFGSKKKAIESTTSFILICLPFIPILFLYSIYVNNNPQIKIVLKSFAAVFIVNSIIVFTLAYARETRLFALPFVIVWPFFGKIINELFLEISNNLRVFTRPIFYLLLVLCSLVLYLSGIEFLYKEKFLIYFFLSSFMCLLVFLIFSLSKTK
jgi:hypothetical protein